MTSLSFVTLFFLSSVVLGNVSGPKSEVFATQWRREPFGRWVTGKHALITPEVSHLAIQACLRQAQERLDRRAYDLVPSFLQEMEKSFQSSKSEYGIALSALTRLLFSLNSIEATSADDYTAKCEATLSESLHDQGHELEPLYAGRLHPEIPGRLSPEMKEKLSRLFGKGLRPAALTWADLEEQVCTLEGYYAVSSVPGLWKFFSLTRAMANVLPSPGGDEAFREEVRRAPRAIEILRQWNRYASVAGKYNGRSIGMTEEEERKSELRFTGPAIGSDATSLLAFFTTAWRETLQRYVLTQDYPAKPFSLIPVEKILMAAGDTAAERHESFSQTEWGMQALWDSFDYEPPDGDETGRTIVQYRKAADLAWLALNAETGIRQNEKISGCRGGEVTTAIYGTRERFATLTHQMEAALDAYRAIDPAGADLPECVSAVRRLNASAASALGSRDEIASLKPEEVGFLAGLEFQPVIADIGMEVDDRAGDQPAGIFRLHLATGYGHALPVTIDGKDYELWTPSAMVLHVPQPISTAQWRKGEVEKYDPSPHHFSP